MAKKDSSKVSVGVGVGVTAALLSAAGAYFLYGSKNAEKNRKLVKSWTLKAKAEVLEGLEKARNMSKDEYEQLVDKTLKSYSKIKGTSAQEITNFAREMKAHWKGLEKKGVVTSSGTKVMPMKKKTPAKPVAKKVAKTAEKV